MSEWMCLLPIGVVLTAALVVVFLDLALSRSDRYLLPWVALAGCVLGLAAVWQTHQTLSDQLVWFVGYNTPLPPLSPGGRGWGEGGLGPLLLGGAFCLDGFGLAIWSLACLAGAFSILAAPPQAEESALSSGEYYGLTLLAVAGMMLLGVAHDWLTLVLSLEIMSVATYVLAGSKREDIRSNEAALKYVVLGGFSTAFLLLGVAFYYGAFGSLSLQPSTALAGLPAAEAQARTVFALLALGLVLVGALFKIGATPFHFWVPDVYEGAPTAITGLMAFGVKAAAFAVLARVGFETFGGFVFRAAWLPLLLIGAILTMVLGNVLALRQSSLKRLLAYSAIAHSGYLLLAFLVMPHVHDAEAMNEHLKSVVFYLLVYGVMTLGAFGVVGLARTNGRPLENMDDYAGWAQERPGLALCMALFMFSLAGLPPTGGFFAKFLIFRGAIAQGLIEPGARQSMIILAAVIGILASVASLYYYLRVVVVMYMSQAPAALPAEAPAAAPCRHARTVELLIYATALATLLSGIIPGWFYWM
ncbi:MAG: NADH-quinone oxidoreductase subunit N [Planctomycetota bacterium]